MSSFYKLFFRKIIISWVVALSFPLYGMDASKERTGEFPERIKVKTIAAYEELLFAQEQEAFLNPNDTYFLLTDWDCTVIGISSLDRKGFLRQQNTGNVINSFKQKNVPVAVVTARWKHQLNPLEYLANMARSMEMNTGVYVSDQVAFKNLQFDLRHESLKRGMFINGICFTGSVKGPVTSALIDHPDIVKATHYFFVDDDPEYISQMVEAFKTRTEKLTVFYYPNKLGKEGHLFILQQHSLFPPIRKLGFLIRHDYTAEVQELLENSDIINELTTSNLTPLLIDLTYSAGEEIAEYVLKKLNYAFHERDLEEIIIFLEQKLSNFVDKSCESISIRWILKDLPPGTLLSLSLRLLKDALPSYSFLMEFFFNSTPNPSSLILDIFSHIPSQESLTLSNTDFFQPILDTNIVKRELMPEFEKRAQELNNPIISERLLKIKIKLDI